MRPVKTLIRLRWSESSLSLHVRRCVFWSCGWNCLCHGLVVMKNIRIFIWKLLVFGGEIFNIFEQTCFRNVFFFFFFFFFSEMFLFLLTVLRRWLIHCLFFLWSCGCLLRDVFLCFVLFIFVFLASILYKYFAGRYRSVSYLMGR